ncbi:hypothetical protein [Methyloversatilis discipulorum]|uniref:hypothetical protein n=1 Tax=Methyloversatilis discipulorum TaxID=1119528 RepID=UPI0012FCD143|nr:hypothetical protein [Methyloversatilis discipulorum]
MEQTSPLEHLSKDELSDLIRRYYSGENVLSLIREFNIHCHVSMLHQFFPPQPTNESCRRCGSAMVRQLLSKSRLVRERLCCIACNHEDTPSCGCAGCLKAASESNARLVRERRKRAVEFCSENWSYSPTHVEPHNLSVRTAVSLLTLVRCCGWIDDRRLGGITSSGIRFAPGGADYEYRLIKCLIDLGIISPDPEYFPYELTQKELLFIGEHLTRVRWTLRVPSAPEFIRKTEEVMRSAARPAGWKAECIEFARELASEECKEFFIHAASERRFGTPSLRSLESLIDNLLKEYSVSQCYQIILTGGRMASDRRTTKGMCSPHAANYMVVACQTHADRARVEGWSIKGYRRPPHLERTQISHVLHDVLMGDGDSGAFYSTIPKQAT